MRFLRLTALDCRGYALPARPVPTAPVLSSGRSQLSCCIRQEQENGTSARARYHDQPSSGNSGSISRRVVTSTVFLCLASAALGSGEASLAEEAKEKLGPSVVESVLSFFDSEETTKSGRRLPKAYIQNAKEVVKTLRDSLGDDAASFRKNADTAKQVIKTYILNWRGSKSVDTEGLCRIMGSSWIPLKGQNVSYKFRFARMRTQPSRPSKSYMRTWSWHFLLQKKISEHL